MSSESSPSARKLGIGHTPAVATSQPSEWPLVGSLIVLLLFSRVIGFVTTHVVNMPFMDEWYVWSDLLDGLDQRTNIGTLLLAPYNGHRLAFVRLMLLVLRPTGWNVIYQVSVTLLIDAVWLAALWYLYRRTARALGVRITRWAIVGFAGLVFACNDINRLWGMGAEWHMLVLAWTLCLMFLSGTAGNWWRLVFGGLCAALASFSVAPGLLTWVVGIPVVWFTTSEKRRRAITAAWTLAAAIFWLLYFRNIPELGGTPILANTLARPLALAVFVFEYLGMPIAPLYNVWLYVMIGSLGVLLSMIGVGWIFTRSRQTLTPLSPWLGLAALSVGAAAMAYVARTPSHVPPYYITIARAFWIAALGPAFLIAGALDRVAWVPMWTRRWGAVLIALLVLAVELPQYGFAAASWSAPREALLQASYDVPDVCSGNWEMSSRITAPPGALRARYPALARHNLSFVHSSSLNARTPADSPNASAGALERAVVEPPAPDEGPACIRLSGWATDPATGEGAREVVLVQGNTVIKRSEVRNAREDGRSRPSDPPRPTTSWTMFVSRTRWPEDPSSLQLYARGRDEATAYAIAPAPGVRFPSGDLSRFETYYDLGTEIRPGAGGDGYVLEGFSGPEPDGRWTDGKEAQILFTLRSPASGALTLSLTATAFLVPQLPEQTAEIYVNEYPVGRWYFELGQRARDEQVAIPREAVVGQKRVVVTLRLPDAASPAHFNLSPDARTLGLKVARVRLAAGSEPQRVPQTAR